MQVIFMRELVGDPFYAVLREYDRCVIDYCLLSDEMSYRGLLSHERAILYAMLKVIERYLNGATSRPELESRMISAGPLYPRIPEGPNRCVRHETAPRTEPH